MITRPIWPAPKVVATLYTTNTIQANKLIILNKKKQ